MSGAALIQQLEAAGEGSRALDRQLMALTYRWEQRHIGCICWDDADDTCCPGGKHLDWVWVDPETDKWVTNAIDGFEFTASVDRALALAERVLGANSGVYWEVVNRGEGPLPFMALASSLASPAAQYSRASTPALALCAAILRAKQ